MRPTLRTVLISGGAWLFGAATAVGIGVVALSLIGGGLGNGGVSPLTAGGQAAAAVPSDPPPTVPTGPAPAVGRADNPSPTATAGADRVLRSAGGFVVARCIGGRAYLVSWTPEQGYVADDVHRGPSLVATVEFKRFTRDVHLAVSCQAGVPQAHEEDEHSDE